VDHTVQADHGLDFDMYAHKLLSEGEAQFTHYIPYQKIIYDLGRCILHDQLQFLLVEIVQRILQYTDRWLETFLQKKTLAEYF